MKTFYFTVRGDRITEKEDYIFVEGNKGSYEAVFDFGAEWEDMAKLCIVENGDDVYKIPIIGNSCLLPEMMKNSARIGVIGVDALDGAELVTRISTNMRGIGVTSGAASREVTASLDSAAQVWEQYLTEMEKCRKAAEDAKEAANTSRESAEAAAENAEKYEKRVENIWYYTQTLRNEAGNYANNAAESEKNAKVSEKEVQTAAAMAQTSENIAKASADKARIYADAAKEYSDTAKEAAKEAVQTYGIGVRTPEGGTILGDLENNVAAAPFTTATGNGCIAGMKGYYYSSVEFGDAIDGKNYGPCIITLSDKQWEAPAQAFEIGYSVGDVISMVNNSKYPDCGTITAINKNVITVDKLPFKAIVDMIEKTGNVASDDYSVFVAEKPLAGDVPLGYGAFSGGEDSITLERAAFGYGRLVRPWGQYGFAVNRETEAGYCAAAFGNKSKAPGQYAFAVNYDTAANGDSSLAAGIRTIANKGQVALGKYNIEDISGKLALIYGNGSSDTERSNMVTLDWSGNAWYAGGIKIGGTSQSDPEAKDVATTDYVDERVKGYVSEKVLRSLFATFKATPLVAGITSEIYIKLLYDVDADSFDIMVDDTVLNNKTPINEGMRIATELLNAENTYIVFYSGEDIVYKCSVMSTIPNFGILFAI